MMWNLKTHKHAVITQWLMARLVHCVILQCVSMFLCLLYNELVCRVCSTNIPLTNPFRMRLKMSFIFAAQTSLHSGRSKPSYFQAWHFHKHISINLSTFSYMQILDAFPISTKVGRYVTQDTLAPNNNRNFTVRCLEFHHQIISYQYPACNKKWTSKIKHRLK